MGSLQPTFNSVNETIADSMIVFESIDLSFIGRFPASNGCEMSLFSK
jgi:hypothetical protein